MAWLVKHKVIIIIYFFSNSEIVLFYSVQQQMHSTKHFANPNMLKNTASSIWKKQTFYANFPYISF